MTEASVMSPVNVHAAVGMSAAVPLKANLISGKPATFMRRTNAVVAFAPRKIPVNGITARLLAPPTNLVTPLETEVVQHVLPYTNNVWPAVSVKSLVKVARVYWRARCDGP